MVVGSSKQFTMAAAEVLKVEMEMSRNNLSYCQIITTQMVSELCIQGYSLQAAGQSFSHYKLRHFYDNFIVLQFGLEMTMRYVTLPTSFLEIF